MKKYITKASYALAIALLALNSCDLDINDNPNAPTATSVKPNFSLNATVAATAYTQAYYFGYAFASYSMGYQVPGDGISGFGTAYTYSYGATSFADQWNRSFDELHDYQTIIEKAEADPSFVVYGAVARIMKVLVYQELVDGFGDLPYSEGLQGDKGILQPKFDKDADIYKGLVGELDKSISELQANTGAVGLAAFGSTNDPMFKGNLRKWIQFANNIKLKLLIHARGTSIDSFVQSAFNTFSPEGFLLEDALVNPGYNANNQQNPMWATYHSSVAGGITQPANYFVPSFFLFAFYDSTKLHDPVRGALTYRGFPNTAKWEIGNEVGRPDCGDYVWFIGTGLGANASTAQGLLKSRAAGYPIFLLAETRLLLAEAALAGHPLEGDAKINFEKGIEASFAYLAIDGTSTAPPSTFNAADETKKYIETNAGSYLANFDLADTDDKKLEAIITQKYIALNITNTFEAWTEFRRTAYPRSEGTDPVYNFISKSSQSTRDDLFIIRMIYPTTEKSANPATPVIPDCFSSPIFWQKK